MRRPLLLLALLATACGVAWLWTHPGDLRLRIDPRSREVALILPREAQGLRTSAAASGRSPNWLRPNNARACAQASPDPT